MYRSTIRPVYNNTNRGLRLVLSLSPQYISLYTSSSYVTRWNRDDHGGNDAKDINVMNDS